MDTHSCSLSDNDYDYDPFSSSSSDSSLERNKIVKINVIKNYEIGDKIGRGSFATVYFAQNLKTGDTVALKKIRLDRYDDDEMENCKNEIQFLNGIKSENVIHCFESFYEKDYLYISLEFADDVDLETKINIMRQRGTLLSERRIWYYFHQICNGLKDIHHAKILHRDLKPANIFMCKNGSVKIGDLGLACYVNDETKLEKSSTGTEYYKAPERLAKDGYHFESDIWSLGCLLYELCTFRSPFAGEISNEFSLHRRIKTADIIPFPMNVYSEPLVFFTYSCLNINPDERPSAQKCHFAARRMFILWEKMFKEYRCTSSF